MANGDLAASAAGFTPVKSTDDIRLGYDRINETADLAVRRGMRAYPTVDAMNAVPGLFLGAIAMVGDVAYRWTIVNNTGKWMLWDYRQVPNFIGLSSGTTIDDGGQGLTELNLIGGMVFLNFSLTRSGGGDLTTQWATVVAGFRPAATIPFGGVTYDSGGNSVGASLVIDAGGVLAVRGNGGRPLYGMRGAVTYRAAL